jgi:predicted DNA binding CopG/RHH family protein
MSNGLQKYVDEQSAVAGYHNDLMMLKAYNKGVAAALAASELQASYAFPPPDRFPDGFRMRGGGSDGYSVGPGSVDNAEYSSLVTGGGCGCCRCGMSGGMGISGGKKVNRLKKAKKWLDFADSVLGVGEKHASAAKEITGSGISGGKKKVNRVKKAKKWLGFVDSALGVGEKHAEAAKEIAGPMMIAAGMSGGKKKVNRVKKAKQWLDFADSALGVGEKHAAAAKEITGGARKPSAWIAHVKKYASEHGIPYKEAMSKAKSTYKSN